MASHGQVMLAMFRENFPSLPDGSVLLLDEFTSAMDALSEAIVLDNLKRSSRSTQRTTIIIAHRLATVREADRIIVMRDGNVVEEGKHDTLVNANGLYGELVKAQKFDKKHSPSSGSSFTMKHDLPGPRSLRRRVLGTAASLSAVSFATVVARFPGTNEMCVRYEDICKYYFVWVLMTALLGVHQSHIPPLASL